MTVLSPQLLLRSTSVSYLMGTGLLASPSPHFLHLAPSQSIF